MKMNNHHHKVTIYYKAVLGFLHSWNVMCKKQAKNCGRVWSSGPCINLLHLPCILINWGTDSYYHQEASGPFLTFCHDKLTLYWPFLEPWKTQKSPFLQGCHNKRRFWQIHKSWSVSWSNRACRIVIRQWPKERLGQCSKLVKIVTLQQAGYLWKFGTLLR